MVEVVATDEFAAWYGDLGEAIADDVSAGVDYLASVGTSLGFPRTSAGVPR